MATKQAIIESVEDFGASELVTLSDGNKLSVRKYDGRIWHATRPDRIYEDYYGDSIQTVQKGDDNLEFYFV